MAEESILMWQSNSIKKKLRNLYNDLYNDLYSLHTSLPECIDELYNIVHYKQTNIEQSHYANTITIG